MQNDLSGNYKLIFSDIEEQSFVFPAPASLACPWQHFRNYSLASVRDVVFILFKKVFMNFVCEFTFFALTRALYVRRPILSYHTATNTHMPQTTCSPNTVCWQCQLCSHECKKCYDKTTWVQDEVCGCVEGAFSPAQQTGEACQASPLPA